MGKQDQILAKEATAAKLLDMSCREFRRLVDAGALPPARFLDRWSVEELKGIASGQAIFSDDIDL